jgi:hypothetical protein
MGLFRSCEDYFLDSEEVPSPLGYQPLERVLLSVLSLQLPFLSTLGDCANQSSTIISRGPQKVVNLNKSGISKFS